MLPCNAIHNGVMEASEPGGLMSDMRTGKLAILQINDTHGYLDQHQEMFWDGDGTSFEKLGGFAKIKGYFDRVRKEYGEDAVIALDNGDTLHGTFPAVTSQGEAMIAPLNLLSLDAWTIHWDIMYGRERLKELAGKLNYPLLAANGFHEDSKLPAFQPSLILERGGLRIGVVGLAAYIIDKTFPKWVSSGLMFTIGKNELTEEIRKLRDQNDVDVIVVLSHLGFPQDCKLASEVDGVDILLSGHTHNRTYRPTVVNGTTIIQSGCHASFVGRLDIDVVDGKVASIRHELVKLDASVAPAADMQKMVDEIYAPHRAALDEVVGQTSTELHRYSALESTMDNFLLDGIAAAAGTEVAFSNGWRYGAPIPAGPITFNDLWNIIPTNPPVSLVEMTGAEMWEMIEENLERTFSSNPYKQMGGFVKRCRGVNIYFKIENPEGARIQDFFVEGNPLEMERTYTVAFVTEQGVAKKYGTNRRELPVRAIDALQNYLKTSGSTSSELRGTFTAV